MQPNGILIKNERMRLGLSQIEVADAAELSRRTVQHIEAGKNGVSVSSVYAVADVLNVGRCEALITDSDTIDNQESFSMWPWRLFELLGKRILPNEHAYASTLAEAEDVVENIWKAWQIHLANILKTKTVRQSAIDKWNRKDFKERYLSVWERNPESLMCSSVDGQRSGVSVLLPVSKEIYESFLMGHISCFDIRADRLCEESQNLIYDCVVEFADPKLKKRHRITESLSFVTFYQLAALSTNSTAPDFRIATYGGAEENIERLANAGLIETDQRTPDFGDAIWEYSGQFKKGFHQIDDDVINRSATAAHYVAMMKRWANSKPRSRIKVKTARNAIRIYQQILKSTSARSRIAG